ncbi:MAG TPA: ABC transporter permease [Solirubrobacteraceae bacterium]|nr:ABC transporter permease [Solirubrobacteraceae bacterium]
MRWLARKDLLILGRSRLLVGLLIVYPVAIALLIGFAISRSPSRPRVAIVDETPPGETVRVGDQHVSVGQYARQLFGQVQAVSVGTRAQAVEQVKSAGVLAAVVIPSDIAARVASATAQAQVEVIYNGDALEQSIVQSQIGSALAQANLGFSKQIQQAAARVIEVLLKGGSLGALGANQNLIALDAIPPLLRGVMAHQPPGPDRAALERVADFAQFAAQNLAISRQVLSTIGQPIRVRSTLLHGRRTPLDTFAVVVAVTVSLMFLCVLLAAGGVALEREEGTLARLVRGLVSREALLAEKSLLAAGCSFAVAFAMLAGVGAFVTLDWGRVGLWVLALAFGALAFGGLGVAIGALAREVRAASLLAFLLSLPLAFLALVPAGSVSGGFYDAIGAISFVFPFKASLQALDAAVNSASPSVGASVAHLAGLTLLFVIIARVGLRQVE